MWAWPWASKWVSSLMLVSGCKDEPWGRTSGGVPGPTASGSQHTARSGPDSPAHAFDSFLRQGLTRSNGLWPVYWSAQAPPLQAQAPQPLADINPDYPQAGHAAPPVLPELGDTASQDLSPAAERRLGDRIMRSIWPDPSVIDDPLVLEYIEQVWQTLLASARQRGEITQDLDSLYAWRPFPVQDRTINAFALPGATLACTWACWP